MHTLQAAFKSLHAFKVAFARFRSNSFSEQLEDLAMLRKVLDWQAKYFCRANKLLGSVSRKTSLMGLTISLYKKNKKKIKKIKNDSLIK